MLTMLQMAYGIATHVPGVLGLRNRLYRIFDPGTASARYCYSVWLRHLVMAHGAGLPAVTGNVAELGPGNSIGIGLAALISGADRYIGLDVVPYAQDQRNLRVFDELVTLFRNRTPIPGPGEMPRIKPFLSDYQFPSGILTEERMRLALDAARLRELRRCLERPGDGTGRVGYIVPWGPAAVSRAPRVDLIFSQAVLEHVDDLLETYRSLGDLLRPGGFMSHQIDFRSHKTAWAWNGHWAYADRAWQLARGRRSYLINREPHSRHIALAAEAGLKVVVDQRQQTRGGLPRHRLAPRFRSLAEEDLTCSGAFIIAVKPSMVS